MANDILNSLVLEKYSMPIKESSDCLWITPSKTKGQPGAHTLMMEDDQLW